MGVRRIGTSRRSGVLAALAFLLVCFVAPDARAQSQDLDVTKFRPSPHSYDVLSVKFADLPLQSGPTGGVLLHYGQHPFVFLQENPDGDVRHEVISDRLTLDVMAAYSFGKRFSVGALMPMVIWNKGEDTGFTTFRPKRGFGVGDLGLSAKAVLIPPAKRFGVAVTVDAHVPTGRKEAFQRNPKPSFTPALVLEVPFKSFRIAGNVGYVARPKWGEGPFEVDDELDLRGGIEIPIIPRHIWILGQIAGTTVVKDFFTNRNNNYREADVGVRLRTPIGLTALVGAGTGFAKGYGNVRIRLFAGISYEPALIGHDSDGDGVDDSVDQCPQDPEDLDGFEDSDGCAEPDNDEDGLPDLADECPDEPEDVDTWQDSDGCPDPDNDSDKILDVDDECPLEPETYNDYVDDDGCPDQPPTATVRGGRIAISEPVYFDTDMDIIKPRSYPILDQVAKLLIATPDIKSVRIDGHTDSRASEAHNKGLSDRRAKAVRRYLMGRGIEAVRMVATGFGLTQPIASNDTEEGRALNRRVEFTILSGAGEDGGAGPAGGGIRTRTDEDGNTSTF